MYFLSVTCTGVAMAIVEISSLISEPSVPSVGRRNNASMALCLAPAL